MTKTFLADGTGTYYDGQKFCYNFKYTLKDDIVSIKLDGAMQCGPDPADYRVSIVGDTLTQAYVQSGYETTWQRKAP